MEDLRDYKTSREQPLQSLAADKRKSRIPNRLALIFPAITHRNFQYYFAGQGISLVGFWLQVVAEGWIAYQLTGSPFWVGLVATVSGLPFLFLSAIAGVFIDKTNRQKLIVGTQIIDLAISLILGLLILTGTVNIYLILLAAFLSGVVGSIDLPARQAFMIEMVGKKDLGSAISINIGVFNAARFIGPAFAGLLIATVGSGWAFVLNSLSFIPGVLAILAVKPVYHYESKTDTHPWESFKVGLRYSFSDKKLAYFMLLGATAAIFIWPYQTLMPVIAEKVFHTGATGFGSLLSAAGLGSLTGAIFTSSQTNRKNKKDFIFLGLLICTFSLLLFTFTRNFYLAHALLFLVGFGIITFISTVNALVQVLAPDEMRGRVTAVYLTMFVGMMPVGNFFAGFIGDKTSAVFSIGLGAFLVLLLTFYLLVTKSLDHI